jgi:flagellar biosynthesis chaperone FliJ
MRKQRTLEAPEERKQRLMQETQVKREQVAADEVAVHRMIRRNIEQFGA